MARDNRLKTISALIENEIANNTAKIKFEAERANYSKAERLSGIADGLEMALGFIRSMSRKDG